MADSFQADQKQEPCHTRETTAAIGSSNSAKRCIVPLRRACAMAQPIVRIQVTGFLKAWSSGRPEALERPMSVVPDELRRLADWESAPIWLTYELAKP